MYDQLLVNKNELNQAVEEVTKLKTRLAILSEQDKNKDKFIEDLVKQIFALSSAIDSPDEFQSQMNMEQQMGHFIQNFMKKGPYKVLKMKKLLSE
jgi:hypothetical protein